MVELDQVFGQGLALRGKSIAPVGFLDEVEPSKLADAGIQDAWGNPITGLAERPKLDGTIP